MSSYRGMVQLGLDWSCAKISFVLSRRWRMAFAGPSRCQSAWSCGPNGIVWNCCCCWGFPELGRLTGGTLAESSKRPYVHNMGVRAHVVLDWNKASCVLYESAHFVTHWESFVRVPMQVRVPDAIIRPNWRVLETNERLKALLHIRLKMIFNWPLGGIA